LAIFYQDFDHKLRKKSGNPGLWHLAVSHEYNSNSMAAVLHINKSNAGGNSKRLHTPGLEVSWVGMPLLKLRRQWWLREKTTSGIALHYVMEWDSNSSTHNLLMFASQILSIIIVAAIRQYFLMADGVIGLPYTNW